MMSFKMYEVEERRQKIKKAYVDWVKSCGSKSFPVNKIGANTIRFFIH